MSFLRSKLTVVTSYILQAKDHERSKGVHTLGCSYFTHYLRAKRTELPANALGAVNSESITASIFSFNARQRRMHK